MNESETRAQHIDPALAAAGWGVVEGSRIRREYPITLGRLEGHGRRGKPLVADYVLEYRNTKLAVIEAKAWDAELTEGLGQAKDYAGKMKVRFSYATNGRGIYGIDMREGTEGELPAYPTPEELWGRTFAEPDAWRDRFAAVPFEDRGGYYQGRYYQDIAVERVMAGIAAGQERILLTLATGTGKTFIAFQIAWKLFQARWNKSNAQLTTDNRQRGKADGQVIMDNGQRKTEESHCPLSTVHSPLSFRRPRILFLADRNLLADQAYNAFSAFPEDALVRIAPDEIRKKGKVPKNGSLFFTIFQTFMCEPGGAAQERRCQKRQIEEKSANREIGVPGKGAENAAFPGNAAILSGSVKNANQEIGAPGQPSPYFGEYPPDFFDFIIIDECHRGGAHDESDWRGILEYFAPAVQLGLTATPKRKDNVDTYAYFGEPVYIYSLKEGINDGFLTPFKVKQIATTIDEYVVEPDDDVIEGEIEPGKRYEERDFNRVLVIEERERKRVDIFMGQIRQNEKTLVFCATQAHALAVRDYINQIKENRDPNYCQRVTANDGALGDQHLRDFQDNEKTVPTILTTSQKLSTGVDARNIRNIVLMRSINSLIEFKQIIGRGSRIYEGKDYFTIYDFVKAHHHFSDPEWDGEPLPPEEKDPCPRCGFRPCVCEKEPPEPCRRCGESPCECVREPCPVCGRIYCICRKTPIAKVKLADGKERTIQHMMSTTFWHPDGKPMSAQQFMELLFGKLPEFFKNEEELRALWSEPQTRRKLLDGLAEKGFGRDQLAEMQKIIDAERSDLFDVLAHVAYAMPPLTREERAHRAEAAIHERFTSKQQTFLEFVLAHYVTVGVEELDPEKLTPLLKLKYHDSISDAVADLGPPEEIGPIFSGFQKYLYQQQESAR